MSDEPIPPEPDDLDVEREQLEHEALRVEQIDPETGERKLVGLISRRQMARAIVERDDL